MTTFAGPVYTLDAVAEFATSAKEQATALAAALTATITDLAQQLSDGELDESEFTDAARQALFVAGADAARLAGLDDDSLVQDLMDGQVDYIDGFASDVSGGLSLEAIAPRAALYGGLAWAAFQIGRAHAIGERSGEKAEIVWTCEDDGASCDDCKANAEGSPYTLDSLPSYPADGGTACLGNCRCSIDGPGGE